MRRGLLRFKSLIVFGLTFGILVLSMNCWAAIALRGTATSATTTNSTLTISKPTGVSVGDFMIVNITQNNTNANPTSSGWTLITGANQGNTRYSAILYMVAFRDRRNIFYI